jgi:hypothetical protein
MKLEGKVHDWAYFTLIKKMRGIGMDLSIEPTFGTKPAYNFNPLKHPAVAKLKLKIKSRLQRNKKEAPVSKKKNALEEQFKHCKKAA